MAIGLILLNFPARITYLILDAAIGASIYFGVAFVIDTNTRDLVIRVAKELRKIVFLHLSPQPHE